MTDPLQEMSLWLEKKVEWPFAAFWEQAERTADFLRQADDAVRLLEEAIGLLVILVGPRGGGKTTAATWWVQDRKETDPETPIVSNVPITGAIYVPDILKFLATKLAVEGASGKNYQVLEDNTVRVMPRTYIPAKMLIIIDEAAISGFEARGSGVGSPLHTYLLALSRKLNVDIVLISQMMCLTAGTLVETPNGAVPIEKIKVGDEVLDNTYWGRRIKKVQAVERQTHARTMEVALESGHSIECTLNHRFPVYVRQQAKKDVEAQSLRVGDMLKVDGWRTPRNTNALFQLLGVIHAEGHWRTTKGMKQTNQLAIYLDKREGDLRDFVVETVKFLRPNCHVGESIGRDGTNRFVLTISKKDDVQFFRNIYDRFLGNPMAVSRDLRASFLSGFFEGDGSVEVKSFTISVCQSKSNGWKLDLAGRLLSSLGIPHKVYTAWRPVGGVAKEYAKEDGYVVSRLKINGAYSGIFANVVGFISAAKQAKADSMTKNLYARIVNIRTIDKPSEVFALSVEGSAPYFVANGIRSHNSMADKRAQWLADFYWLCEAVAQAGTKLLDHFRYRIYNEQYRKTQEFNVSRQDAIDYLFGKFDTYDIPNYEVLAEAFTIQYQITEDDRQFYKDVRDRTQHIPKQPVSENVVIFSDRKALRAPSGRYPGETFLVVGKDGAYHRFEVLQRDWDMAEKVYTYRAREVPTNVYLEDVSEVAPELTA